ncbi:MAG: hypothetical protein CL424_05380 [Acidimicrobiaceae bacterium]|nr:hypothetical protein [Acidimicrobiaceae bacterium]
MSVDTNTTNKNLAPYTQVRHPDFTILVSPVLSGIASQMRIVTKGRFVKQLAVELSDEPHRPAYAPRGSC